MYWCISIPNIVDKWLRIWLNCKHWTHRLIEYGVSLGIQQAHCRSSFIDSILWQAFFIVFRLASCGSDKLIKLWGREGDTDFFFLGFYFTFVSRRTKLGMQKYYYGWSYSIDSCCGMVILWNTFSIGWVRCQSIDMGTSRSRLCSPSDVRRSWKWSERCCIFTKWTLSCYLWSR